MNDKNKKQDRFSTPNAAFWFSLGVLSTLFWKLVQRFRKILQKPKHLPVFMSLDHRIDMEMMEKGYHIAVENLKSGIELRHLPNGETKRVLCAGHRNFREPWARDLSFALFGLMEIGEAETAKESLDVFLHFQKPSGQFPVKCYSTGIVDRYVHSLFERRQPTHIPLRPKYISGHRTISLDGNGLLVIGAFNYATYSGDIEFVCQHWNALQQAVLWMEAQALDESNLLYQQDYSDWADSLARTGHVLYTNLIYWKALNELADFSLKLDKKDDAQLWKGKAIATKRAIQKRLWRGDLGYFVTSEEFENLSSAGNLLAISWGLATKTQADSILDALLLFGMADPVPTKVMEGDVPLKYVALENRLAGIPEYHTQAAWLWLGAWHAISLAQADRAQEADEILERILKIVVRDRIVYEVYGVDGHYLNTRWYTAEAPLTWNAGMLVYAWHCLIRNKKGKTGRFESEKN
jgi:GH15 family glucan-1,4-alpha-glucosidase